MKMMIMFNLFKKLGYIQVYLCAGLLGFTITFLILYFLLNGFLGKYLQNKLLFSLKDKSWFNQFLVMFVVIYFIIGISIICNIIALDNNDDYTIQMMGVTFKFSPDILYQIGILFGSASAYVVGSKIAYGIVAKTPYSMLTKGGISFAGGSGSAIGYNMVLDGILYVRGKLNNNSGTSNVKISIDQIELTKQGSSKNSIQSKIITAFMEQGKDTNKPQVFSKTPNSEIESKLKLIDEQVQFKTQASRLLGNESSSIQTSKVISAIKQNRGKKLEEVFESNVVSDVQVFEVKDDKHSFSDFIKSPLEPTELILTSDKVFIVKMLTNDLILHFIMLYLVCMLILIFSVKLMVDKDLYSQKFENKVKSLPLGKYIQIIISKLINSWKFSNSFWIYLIIGFLLIFLSCSTFGIFVCLFSLKA